jgi:protein-tyrosine phosphatase
MSDRRNVLVVCGKNKKRSKTAEFIFKNDGRLNIRSAGLSPKSERKVTAQDLDWADLVFVMETDHRNKIWDLYRQFTLPPIEVLDIADEYEFMDEELVDMLFDKMNHTFKNRYNI